MQKHGKQLAMSAKDEAFKVLEEAKVGGIRITKRKNYKRDAIFCCCPQSRKPHIVDELPKSRSAKLKNGARKIDGRVIIKQPPSPQGQQRLCHR